MKRTKMHKNALTLRPVHPFPARMASSIAWEELRKRKAPIRVLDPMSGSGTTLATARKLGHSAIGFDTDPLAITIARSWCTDVQSVKFDKIADAVLDKAKQRYKKMPLGKAYPLGSDEETHAFIRFWFDDTNRRQLAALSREISSIKETKIRTLLWCAFSKLIITKSKGVSRALDISHSRPHRFYTIAPLKAFDGFPKAVKSIISSAPFTGEETLPAVKITQGDARHLPLDAASVDMVVTSPPYLNAIDYMRGHKLSLVWMGHTIEHLRSIRSANIGTEISESVSTDTKLLSAFSRMGKVNKLSKRTQGMLTHYVSDMNLIMKEISRVLVTSGKATLVVGDSTIRGIFIENSKAISYLGAQNGLKMISRRHRPLPENRRYLPPPEANTSGAKLQSRMREEVILTFKKVGDPALN